MSTQRATPCPDVAIVGLGPTGATLAALLAGRGYSVSVFERHPDVFPLPRAVHFDAEVMRIFQRAGIADRLPPAIRPLQGMDMLRPDGLRFAHFAASTEAGPHGWPEGYMFHQPALERLLRDHLGECTEVELNLGVEVTAIDLADEGASLTLAEGDRIDARFVVACDGARSLGLECLETEVRDWEVDQPWLVIDLLLEPKVKMPEVTVQYCEPSRPASYVPTPGGRCRFEIRVLPGDDRDAMLAPESIAGMLERWISPESYTLERAAIYTFRAVVAERWQRGPLFVAGDAVHQMPPFLGQGMCSGIRDVANLAWKLDLVLDGRATPALLDSYTAERAPHVHRIVEADLYLGHLIQPVGGPREGARPPGDSLPGDHPLELESPVYPIGPGLGVGEGAGLPFPQPLLPSGQRFDEVMGPGFALVGAVEHSDRAEQILNQLGARLITDLPERLNEFLAGHTASAAVVRPDRLVLGMVSSSEELDQALEPLGSCLVAPSELHRAAPHVGQLR